MIFYLQKSLSLSFNLANSTYLWPIAIFYEMSAAPWRSCRHFSVVCRCPSNRAKSLSSNLSMTYRDSFSASGGSVLVLHCYYLPLFSKKLCTEPATFCFVKLMALRVLALFCRHQSLSWLAEVLYDLNPAVWASYERRYARVSLKC